MLVERSVLATFRTGAIVREKENNRVLRFADLFKKGQETANLSVGVSEKTGEDLLAPGVHSLFVWRKIVPCGDPRRPLGQYSVFWYDPFGHLSSESSFPPSVPTIVEHSPVGLNPLLRDVVGSVHRTESPIEEERLLLRRVFLMENHAHRLFCEVLGQVVAVLGTSGRIDVVVVTHQIRSPVIRVALEESVVALESEAKRPSIERSDRRPLSSRREVPLPDGESAVTGVTHDPGEGRRLLRHVDRIPRVVHWSVDEEPDADCVMIPASEKARSCRRAQGGHVKTIESDSSAAEMIDVGCSDIRSVGS
jgi:hypothetical protein